MSAPLILSIFPTFAMGGAQSRYVTVANSFGKTVRHAIVAMDGVTTARERLDPSLSVDFPHVAVRRGDTLGNVFRFRAFLRELRPHTLLTHNFGSIEWAMANRFAMTRHVHVEDGFGPEERDRQIARRVWLRRVFLHGRTVALPSETLVRIAREDWRLRQRDLRYVPNGIDLNRFAPERQSGRQNERVVVGTVAALRAEKNIGRLIRAFHAATEGTNASLTIVGDGDERSALESLSDTLGLGDRVRFTGHISNPAPLIAQFDVFALSSDTEQMPISLLEAMAAGRAVAATDVGDVATILGHAQREFVTGKTDAKLSKALSALIQDETLRNRLGNANREKVVAEYGLDRMLGAWWSLLVGDTGFADATVKPGLATSIDKARYDVGPTP